MLDKSFHRKVQSRKIFTHRESFETIIAKTEEKLSKVSVPLSLCVCLCVFLCGIIKWHVASVHTHTRRVRKAIYITHTQRCLPCTLAKFAVSPGVQAMPSGTPTESQPALAHRIHWRAQRVRAAAACHQWHAGGLSRRYAAPTDAGAGGDTQRPVQHCGRFAAAGRRCNCRQGEFTCLPLAPLWATRLIYDYA